jgi:hypothetical protein
MRPVAHALASFAQPLCPLRFEISDRIIDHPGRKRPLTRPKKSLQFYCCF